MRPAMVFAHPSGGPPLTRLARESRQISPAEPDTFRGSGACSNACMQINKQVRFHQTGFDPDEWG